MPQPMIKKLKKKKSANAELFFGNYICTWTLEKNLKWWRRIWKMSVDFYVSLWQPCINQVLYEGKINNDDKTLKCQSIPLKWSVIQETALAESSDRAHSQAVPFHYRVTLRKVIFLLGTSVFPFVKWRTILTFPVKLFDIYGWETVHNRIDNPYWEQHGIVIDSFSFRTVEKL